MTFEYPDQVNLEKFPFSTMGDTGHVL